MSVVTSGKLSPLASSTKPNRKSNKFESEMSGPHVRMTSNLLITDNNTNSNSNRNTKTTNGSLLTPSEVIGSGRRQKRLNQVMSTTLNKGLKNRLAMDNKMNSFIESTKDDNELSQS